MFIWNFINQIVIKHFAVFCIFFLDSCAIADYLLLCVLMHNIWIFWTVFWKNAMENLLPEPKLVSRWAGLLSSIGTSFLEWWKSCNPKVSWFRSIISLYSKRLLYQKRERKIWVNKATIFSSVHIWWSSSTSDQHWLGFSHLVLSCCWCLSEAKSSYVSVPSLSQFYTTKIESI